MRVFKSKSMLCIQQLNSRFPGGCIRRGGKEASGWTFFGILRSNIWNSGVSPDSILLPSHFILLWLIEEMPPKAPLRHKWNRTQWIWGCPIHSGWKTQTWMKTSEHEETAETRNEGSVMGKSGADNCYFFLMNPVEQFDFLKPWTWITCLKIFLIKEKNKTKTLNINTRKVAWKRWRSRKLNFT